MDKPKHWEGQHEKGAYLALKTTVFLLNHLGRPLCSGILYIVIAYYFLTTPSARQASRRFLDRAMPEQGGKISNRMVYRHLLSFGQSVLDKFSSWQGHIPLAAFRQHNRELFAKRIEDGRGGIWMISHLGNMEACQAVFHKCQDVPVTALVHTKHAKSFNRLICELNPENQVELLQVSDFDIHMVMGLQEKLSRGEFVFIAGDRTPVENAGRVVKIHFLGKDASFPFGPFLLASLLDCPVGAVFCLKTDKGFDLTFHDLPGLKGVSRRNRDEAIRKVVAKFAGLLESYCKQSPLQWFNFFDFWGEDMVSDDRATNRKSGNRS